jgi:SPP1 gp7 family putative phage head morphogenesis protein
LKLIHNEAWANGWTLQDTIAEITGEDAKQGTSSQLQRIGVQASAVLATAVQHVSAISGASVVSSLYGFYRWFSVIDSSTTEICRGRNGKRFRFGAGPLPPAHIRCRSHIAPIVGNDDIAAVSFYTWAASQPEDLQNDILGEADAEALRTGKLKEKDLAKFQAKPLTIDEFRRKINEVLSR